MGKFFQVLCALLILSSVSYAIEYSKISQDQIFNVQESGFTKVKINSSIIIGKTPWISDSYTIPNKLNLQNFAAFDTNGNQLRTEKSFVDNNISKYVVYFNKPLSSGKQVNYYAEFEINNFIDKQNDANLISWNYGNFVQGDLNISASLKFIFELPVGYEIAAYPNYTVFNKKIEDNALKVIFDKNLSSGNILDVKFFLVPSRPSISITKEISQTTFQSGDNAIVTLKIKNAGNSTLFNVETDDDYGAPAFEKISEISVDKYFVLKPEEEKQYSYVVKPLITSGLYSFRASTVSAEDGWGTKTSSKSQIIKVELVKESPKFNFSGIDLPIDKTDFNKNPIFYLSILISGYLVAFWLFVFIRKKHDEWHKIGGIDKAIYILGLALLNLFFYLPSFFLIAGLWLVKIFLFTSLGISQSPYNIDDSERNILQTLPIFLSIPITAYSLHLISIRFDQKNPHEILAEYISKLEEKNPHEILAEYISKLEDKLIQGKVLDLILSIPRFYSKSLDPMSFGLKIIVTFGLILIMATGIFTKNFTGVLLLLALGLPFYLFFWLIANFGHVKN